MLVTKEVVWGGGARQRDTDHGEGVAAVLHQVGRGVQLVGVLHLDGATLLLDVVAVHVRATGVVDQRELQQRAKHERQADAGPHVDSLQQTGRRG